MHPANTFRSLALIVFHGVWLSSCLQVWAENGAIPTSNSNRTLDYKKSRPRKHPTACTSDYVSEFVQAEFSELTLELPSGEFGPSASDQLHRDENAKGLYPWKIPSVSMEEAAAIEWLLAGLPELTDILVGDSLRYLQSVANFGVELLARGRVLPALVETAYGYDARWRPVVAADDSPRLEQMVRSMPAVFRSVRTEQLTSADITRDVLEHTVDFVARNSIPALFTGARRRGLSVTGRWLDALSGSDAQVDASDDQLDKLALVVDEWRSSAAQASQTIRTLFRLVPPSDEAAEHDPQASWSLDLMLQSILDPSLMVPAKRIWSDDIDSSDLFDTEEIFREDVEFPHEVLLRDLGRAARLYPELERVLEQAHPDRLGLDATGAAVFLQEAAPLLSQAGFGVLLPSWWGTKRAKLGARLRTKTKSSKSAGVASGLLGLKSLCQYSWEVALGGKKLSAAELTRLAQLKQPLVRMRGEWVHLNPTDIAAALAIASDTKKKDEMTAGDALRIGLGLQEAEVGLPVIDIEADGWLGELLHGSDEKVEQGVQPEDFGFELRPYQLRGVGWLNFHQRFGLGACLADDMGLGKTAQLLALIANERADSPGPTLLICPMSLVGNWQREAAHVTPQLRVHVHHGSDRMAGDKFIETARDSDLVLTTYQLVVRDQQLLARINWPRVALDEAQNIKNADAGQAKAVRALPCASRVALTGTPVENRLSELWSIMEFLNPGLLGSSGAFRKRFANPIEREQDDEAAERLKRLTGPFILRRLKTDKSIITDLPEKLEMKTYCNLTREQASLYKAVVDDMMQQIEEAEGMARKGLVLSVMLKLKQVCNHPAHFLSDGSELRKRSGKLERLEQITEEVLLDKERILIFTQFAEMGEMLREHLAQQFDTNVAWLHGGVKKSQRDKMVEQFQSGEDPSIFLLSLKAGGTGLTLTGANHVVHFDRWWNPAVENQATDRAFRIGQHRNVQVRKFVTVGTLEERIDQMIESKAALADRIVGTGESWITELSTSALRDVIALSEDAVMDDGVQTSKVKVAR